MKRMLQQPLCSITIFFLLLTFVLAGCNNDDDGGGGVQPVITFGSENFADGDTINRSETLVITTQAEKGASGANLDSFRVMIYVDEYDVALVWNERGNIDQAAVSWDTIAPPLIFPNGQPLTMRVEVSVTDQDGNRTVAERAVYVANEFSPHITINEGSVQDGATLRAGETYRLSFRAKKGDEGENIIWAIVNQYVNDAMQPTVLLDTTGLDLETFEYDTEGMTATSINNQPTAYRLEILAFSDVLSYATDTKNISYTVIE